MRWTSSFERTVVTIRQPFSMTPLLYVLFLPTSKVFRPHNVSVLNTSLQSRFLEEIEIVAVDFIPFSRLLQHNRIKLLIMNALKSTNFESLLVSDDTPPDQKKGLKIMIYLMQNCEECIARMYVKPQMHFENGEYLTLASQFIRQWLNNADDGHGLNNVEEVYKYLLKKKDFLIKYHMVDENVQNLFGFPLWTNYHFNTGVDLTSSESASCVAMAMKNVEKMQQGNYDPCWMSLKITV